MEWVKAEIRDETGFLSLNNPEALNSFSEAQAGECLAFLNECRDKKVRAVVLSAEPNKHNIWSAGIDIKELPKGERDPLGYNEPMELLLHAVEEVPFPVIAAVKGGVWGGACDLVMTCDIVVADKSATFAITPAKLCIPYNITGVLHFVNRIGLSQAKAMYYTADPVDAETATQWGIVTYLKDDPFAFAQELCKKIRRNAALSVAAMKEEFRVIAHSTSLTLLEFERIQGLRRTVYNSEDYKEGLASFLEKRRPVYTGK
ncbi:MAG: methylmalonyl-CoA decarboxylase [Myxococcota bacterium]|jgi:methylmalonyl-CoA decarboxylase